jgi:ketosteroid isomerase-like protein
MADIDAIVRSLADSLRSGDADGFIAYLAPDAVLWHNDTRREVDAAETLRGIGARLQLVRDRKPEIVRVSPTIDGFVMQFALRGTVVASDNPFEMQNCIVVSIVDDQVTRIDEYVDPTVAAQLG